MRMPRRRDHRVNHHRLAYVSFVRSALFSAYSILVVRSSQLGGRVLATPHREARRVPAGKPARGCGPPLFSNPPSGVSARQPSRQMALGCHLSRCLRGPHRPPWPLTAFAMGGSPTGSRLRCAARRCRSLPCVRWVSGRFLTFIHATPSPGHASRQFLSAAPAAPLREIVTPHGVAPASRRTSYTNNERHGWARMCSPLHAVKESTPMPNNPNHYHDQAHRLLRYFVAARDSYVAQVHRDDTTHPVRDSSYERQFTVLRDLIAEALHHRDQRN